AASSAPVRQRRDRRARQPPARWEPRAVRHADQDGPGGEPGPEGPHLVIDQNVTKVRSLRGADLRRSWGRSEGRTAVPVGAGSGRFSCTTTTGGRRRWNSPSSGVRRMPPGALGNAPESASESARELHFLGEPNHLRDLASQCPFSVGYDPRTLAGSAIP